jgi:hypothetical protein
MPYRPCFRYFVAVLVVEFDVEGTVVPRFGGNLSADRLAANEKLAARLLLFSTYYQS